MNHLSPLPRGTTGGYNEPLRPPPGPLLGRDCRFSRANALRDAAKGERLLRANGDWCDSTKILPVRAEEAPSSGAVSKRTVAFIAGAGKEGEARALGQGHGQATGRPAPELSVVIAVSAGGHDTMQACLAALEGSPRGHRVECIVPFDSRLDGVDALGERFPWIDFADASQKIDAARFGSFSREHHDVLRAIGLRQAHAPIVHRSRVILALPLIALLQTIWSFGECVGYFTGRKWCRVKRSMRVAS